MRYGVQCFVSLISMSGVLCVGYNLSVFMFVETYNIIQGQLLFQ